MHDSFEEGISAMAAAVLGLDGHRAVGVVSIAARSFQLTDAADGRVPWEVQAGDPGRRKSLSAEDRSTEHLRIFGALAERTCPELRSR
jgi:hypothetical protein